MTSTQKKKKSKIFKIIIIMFLALVLLVAFLPSLISTDTVKDMITSYATKGINQTVEIEKISLSWFRGVVVTGITINDKDQKQPPLLTIDKVEADFAWIPLLSGSITIKEVFIDSLTAKVLRNSHGKLNIPEFNEIKTAFRKEHKLVKANFLAASLEGLGDFDFEKIKVNKVTLKNTKLSYNDQISQINTNWILPDLTVTGESLAKPLYIKGTILPIDISDNTKGNKETGKIDFTAEIDLIKENRLNIAGKAQLEIKVNNLNISQLASQFPLDKTINEGEVNGNIKIVYDNLQIFCTTNDLQLANFKLIQNNNKPLTLPLTTIAFNLEPEINADKVIINSLSINNSLLKLQGKGLIYQLKYLSADLLPAVNLELISDFNLTSQLEFLANNGILQVEGLKVLSEQNNLSAKVLIKGGSSLNSSPVNISANIIAKDTNINYEDITAKINSKNINIQATLGLTDQVLINAAIKLDDLPITVNTPKIPGDISLNLNATTAITNNSDKGLLGEIKLTNTSIHLPRTEFTKPFDVDNINLDILADLANDNIIINKATINLTPNSFASIRSGNIKNFLSGKIEGKVEAEFSSKIEELCNLLSINIPQFDYKLKSDTRGALRIILNEKNIDLTTTIENDNLKLLTKYQEEELSLEASKTVLRTSAVANMDELNSISIKNFDIESSGIIANSLENKKPVIAANIAPSKLSISGHINLLDTSLVLNKLNVNSSSIYAKLNKQDKQGEVTSGIVLVEMEINENKPAIIPLNTYGKLTLPNLSATIDNTVFKYNDNNSLQTANLGKIKLLLDAEGILENISKQQNTELDGIKIKKLEITANPFVVQLQGVIDRFNKKLQLAYAARIAPARMKSFLDYLQIPNNLFGDAEFTGKIAVENEIIEAAGKAKGFLGLQGDRPNPFSFTHDFIISFPAIDQLSIDMKKLEGGIAVTQKEAIMSIVAKPGKFILTPNSTTGLLDLSINGAASSSKTLALGILRTLPGLESYADLLSNTELNGIYNAWLLLEGKNDQLQMDIGGIWKGARLIFKQDNKNKLMLSEPDQLGVSLKANYAFGNRQLIITNFAAISKSAPFKAVATASLNFAKDNMAIENPKLSAKFIANDLQKASKIIPGILSPELNILGSLSGGLNLSGSLENLQLDNTEVNFYNFSMNIGNSQFHITNGKGDLYARIAINKNVLPRSELEYDFLRYFNITQAKANLHGAVFDVYPLKHITNEFNLINGLVTLNNLNINLGDNDNNASVNLHGSVDFNHVKPNTNLNLSLVNIPFSEFTSDIKDYLIFEKGTLFLPSENSTNKSANIKFSGFSEQDILSTLSLNNFNFSTTPISIYTGNSLNNTLNSVLKNKSNSQDPNLEGRKHITLKEIKGTILANGTGVIDIPKDNPIMVIGDNTADYNLYGNIKSDKTISLEVAIVKNLNKLISIPRLIPFIPGINTKDPDTQGKFAQILESNANKGHYKVKVTGTLDKIQLTGIPELIATIIKDITIAIPAATVLNTLETGKNIGTIPFKVTKGLGKNIANIISGGAKNNQDDSSNTGEGDLNFDDSENDQQEDLSPAPSTENSNQRPSTKPRDIIKDIFGRHD